MRSPAFHRATAIAAAVAVSAASSHAQDPAQQRDSALKRTVSADLSYITFDDHTDAWQQASISLSNKTSRGSVIARVNYANRFSTTGAQVEVDAYPRLAPGKYFYLNLGYSGASIFPEWRYGIEYNQSLPNAWEGSFGMRYLEFGGAPVVLWTGSVGKYIGNWWYNVRPFVRFKDAGTSASAGFTARRYYEDSDNYWAYSVSAGSSPTDRITPDAVGRTSSASASLYGSHSLTKSIVGTWNAGWSREELSATHARGSLSLSAGISVRY